MRQCLLEYKQIHRACYPPEWTPIRSLSLSCGWWGILKVSRSFLMVKDTNAISLACRLPFLIGRPLATYRSYHWVSVFTVFSSYHIRVANCFNFIRIKLFENTVEHSVQIVEHRNNVHWSSCGGYCGESDDIAEVNGHTIERFWINVLSSG